MQIRLTYEAPDLRRLRDRTWRRVAAACSIRYRSARGRPGARRSASIEAGNGDCKNWRQQKQTDLGEAFFIGHLFSPPPARPLPIKFAPTRVSRRIRQTNRRAMGVCQRAVQSQTRPSRAIGRSDFPHDLFGLRTRPTPRLLQRCRGKECRHGRLLHRFPGPLPQPGGITSS